MLVRAAQQQQQQQLTVVDVLQGSSPTVLHADPQLLPAAANEGDGEVRGTAIQQSQQWVLTQNTEPSAETRHDWSQPTVELTPHRQWDGTPHIVGWNQTHSGMEPHTQWDGTPTQWDGTKHTSGWNKTQWDGT